MNDPIPLTDLANPKLILPALIFLMTLFALAIAVLPANQDRTKRSLALLILLLGAFAILKELLPLALSSGLSLAVFFGIFGVFYLLGKFDAPR